jgi:hypothetical protein
MQTISHTHNSSLWARSASKPLRQQISRITNSPPVFHCQRTHCLLHNEQKSCQHSRGKKISRCWLSWTGYFVQLIGNWSSCLSSRKVPHEMIQIITSLPIDFGTEDGSKYDVWHIMSPTMRNVVVGMLLGAFGWGCHIHQCNCLVEHSHAITLAGCTEARHNCGVRFLWACLGPHHATLCLWRSNSSSHSPWAHRI